MNLIQISLFMMIVEVFKTDVENCKEAWLLMVLYKQFPGFTINFDLEDCDRILRVQGENVSTERVIQLLNEHDCFCEPLE
jgi:hypothetical protein